MNLAGVRWMALRVDMLSAFFIGVVAFSTVLLIHDAGTLRSKELNSVHDVHFRFRFRPRRSTRMRLHLKTQTFCYVLVSRPHENDVSFSMKTQTFGNALQSGKI